MAVARHPVARIAPPAPAIISASRARVGERDGERGNFPLILQCRQTPPPFRARARPSADSGHHPRTTRMSLGGGECRVGRAAAPWDHHRRRGAESSAIDRHQQTIDVGHRPLPHTAPHKLLPPVGHPAGRSRMLVAVHGLALRSASDAIRAPLTELLKPDGCRAPPRSSHRAAGARHHQHLARASG
jgi:hypothetical protein